VSWSAYVAAAFVALVVGVFLYFAGWLIWDSVRMERELRACVRDAVNAHAADIWEAESQCYADRAEREKRRQYGL
jgi:hypothetical protein